MLLLRRCLRVFLRNLFFCSFETIMIVRWASISFVHPPMCKAAATKFFACPWLLRWCFLVECIRRIRGLRIHRSWRWLLHWIFNVSRWWQRRWLWIRTRRRVWLRRGHHSTRWRFQIRIDCVWMRNRVMLRPHTWRRFQFRIEISLLFLLLCCCAF